MTAHQVQSLWTTDLSVAWKRLQVVNIFTVFNIGYAFNVGRDSSVGIATRYGLDGPENESQ